MSDYCESCKFNPKKNCKVSSLYWAFLERHKDAFTDNIRMAMPLRNLEKRNDERKLEDSRTYQEIINKLLDGKLIEVN